MAFLLRLNRKRELSWVRAAHRAVLFSLLLPDYITDEMKIQKSTEKLVHSSNISRSLTRILRLFIVGLVLASTSTCAAQTLDVYAAASLKSAIDEIAANFAAQTGQEPRLSYAASSILALQIKHGAPADVFVSANLGWMHYLEQLGVLQNSAQNIASNRLVFASAAPIPLSLELPDILGRLAGGRLAVPLISSVPLGLYAAQSLQNMGFLTALTPYLAQQDNARSSLISVLRGEVALGILYASDVAIAPEVITVAEIPLQAHDPVTYQAASISPRGAEFVDYLTKKQAQAVFMRYGFLAP